MTGLYLYRQSKSYDNTPPFEIIVEELDIFSDISNELLNEGLNLFEKKQNELKKKLSDLKSKDREDAEIYAQHVFVPENIKLMFIKKSLLYAVLMQIYSFVELGFEQIANVCIAKFNYDYNKEKNNKYRGDIGKYLFYIEDSSYIQFDDLMGIWNEIDIFRLVRNCIVHSNGVFYKNDDLYQIKKPIKHLDIFDVKNASGKNVKHELLPSKIYIEYMCTQSVKFLKLVMERIWKSHFA